MGGMRRLPRSMPIRILIALVGLLAIAWVVLRHIAGASDPVSDREALSTFNAAPPGSVPAGGPAPGVYRYRATGSERGGAGPLSISRDTPGAARLVVTSSGSGWEAELSYSRQHIEGARYELRDGAIRVTSRRTKVTFAGFGQDERRTVDPPSVFLPAGARPGTQWTEAFHTGDVSVSTQNRVLRTEQVAVDGKGLDTLVVESRSTTSGVHPGTRTEILWWAPALGLPVRWDVNMDIGGVFAFRSRISVALVSAIAAR